MIKRIVSLFICVCLLSAFVSCSNDPSNDDPLTSESDKIESSVPDANSISLPLNDITAFHSGADEIKLDYNSIFSTDNTGVTEVSNTQNEEKSSFSNTVLPFSVEIGNSFSDVCTAVQLESGYAICGEAGTTPEQYDKEKAVDFTDGHTGALYFGYKVEGDKCIPIEYSVLLAIITGKLMSYQKFDLIMVSMSFDSNEKLTSSLFIYTDFGIFSSIMK